MPRIASFSSRGLTSIGLRTSSVILPYPSVNILDELFKFTYNTGQITFGVDSSFNKWENPPGNRGSQSQSFESGGNLADSVRFYRNAAATNNAGIVTLLSTNSSSRYAEYHNSRVADNSWTFETEFRILDIGFSGIDFITSQSSGANINLRILNDSWQFTINNLVIPFREIPSNTWYHLVISATATADAWEYTIYIDGKREAVASGSKVPFSANTNLLSGGLAIGTTFQSGSFVGATFDLNNTRLVAGNPFSGTRFELPTTAFNQIQSTGVIDSGFTANTGSGTFDWVHGMALCPATGKIVVGGGFTSFNGSSAAARLVRLNLNGSLDTSFSVGTGFNNRVNAIVTLADGKMIVGGNFTTYRGETVNYLVKLNVDGTRDTSFNTGTGFTSNVLCLKLQHDGKILVGGSFTTFNGVSVVRLARLNTDGTLDTAFNTNIGTGANGDVRAITIRAFGGIIVGGNFTTFNGVTVNRIVALFSGGIRNTAFTTSTGTAFDSSVEGLATYGDNIVAVGNFSNFNGTARSRITMLNENGTLNTSFVPSIGSLTNLLALAVDDYGKILAVGNIAGGIIRINSDGTKDNSFTTNLNQAAFTVLTMPDNRVLAGGTFTTVNGVSRNRIVMLK